MHGKKKRISKVGSIALTGFFFAVLFLSPSAHATWSNPGELEAVVNGGSNPPIVNVRAQHITEMKQALAAKESVCGTPGDTTPVGQSTPILLSHIVDLRNRLTTLYTNAGHAGDLPAWAPLTVNVSRVRAADILAIRSAIDNFDTSWCGGGCNGDATCDAGETCAACPADNCCFSCTDPATCGPGAGTCPVGKTCYDTPAACTANAATDCTAGCNIFPGNMSLCNAGECCLPDTVNGPPYEVCVASACVPANQATVCTGLPSVNSCGVLDAACPGTMVCNAPACWGCFDAGGSPSGAYCYSDGSIGQTNACMSACGPPFPLPAQVPMFYCGAASITARIGDATGICGMPWDVYYVAPPATGFQQGALVYYDSSLNNPVLTDLIGDPGGAIYDLTGAGGNEIGPPTGNSC